MKIFIITVLIGCGLFSFLFLQKENKLKNNIFLVNTIEDNSNVMVPIPIKLRVYNKSSIQCVWATLETLGLYAREPKLFNLTNKPEYQGTSDPRGVGKALTQLKVKFEQTIDHSDKHLIIKSIVKEKRGCLFDILGHVMTLVHYDEKNDIVKYIDNSDPELKIKTWTLEEFDAKWKGWICVIYADNDVSLRRLPIINKNNNNPRDVSDDFLMPNN